MTELGKLWTGNVFGTNTGNLFVELVQTPSGVSGTLRFIDNIAGLVIYKVNGEFADGKLQLQGSSKQTDQGEESHTINATAVLTSQGLFRGRWESSLGNAGTFVLYPHDLPPAIQVKQSDNPVPEQLHTSRQTAGAIRLYAEDFHELAQVIKRDFDVGQLVVTYQKDKIENTRFLEQFATEMTSLGEVQYLKLFIQELEAHGLNRVVVVELNSQGRNDVIVQGVDASWVIGKTQIVMNQLHRYEKSLVTNTKKYGLGINQLIVITMLVLFPEIATLEQRSIFAFILVAIIFAFVWAHWRFLPNFILYTAARQQNIFSRVWPSLFSWMGAVSAALVAAVAFHLLTQ